MQTVRVGFVGCGFMGQLVHLPNFTSLPDCEVVALAEMRSELGKRVAHRYNIPRVYQSHAELAQDHELEAVVVIMSEHLHHPIAIDLLRAGKHVYIEKPLAGNPTDGEQMVLAAEQSSQMLMVGYMKRYDPGVELAKAKVEALRASGELGRIVYAKMHCLGGDWIYNLGTPLSTNEPAPAVEIRVPAWLPKEHETLYWTFQNVYCHDLNLLRYLLGEVQEVEYVDLIGPVKMVRMRFADCHVVLETGWAAPNAWDEQLTIFFEQGRVMIDLPPPLFRNQTATLRIEKKGEHTCFHASPDWAFRRAAAHFIECIQKKEMPRSGAEDSLRDLKLVEKIFRAI
jgi:predicted dehydrogenase